MMPDDKWQMTNLLPFAICHLSFAFAIPPSHGATLNARPSDGKPSKSPVRGVTRQ